jgi:hypothetical protein
MLCMFKILFNFMPSLSYFCTGQNKPNRPNSSGSNQLFLGVMNFEKNKLNRIFGHYTATFHISVQYRELFPQTLFYQEEPYL